jgi:putative transposase
MGVRKIYFLIKKDMDRVNIKKGRDALFDLMASEHMLVQRRKRKHITTNSNHWYRKYQNLIK